MKRLLLASLIFCFVTSVIAQTKKHLVSPTPGWVTINKIAYNEQHLDQDAEDGYIDIDHEEQVNLQAQSTYYKTVLRVITTAGVENASEVSVTFDPTYSSLIFHTVKIIRGGQTLQKLNINAIKMVQQETELSMHLYNGSVTAILFIEDVRKGDVIEYSYSIKGFNPIFKNKFATSFATNASYPFYNFYYKVITPNERQLTIKSNDAKIKPVTTRSEATTTYEWSFKNVKGVKLNDNIPEWLNPYDRIMVSEYRSWAEIVSWGMELFPMNVKPSPALQAEINDIVRKNTSNTAKVAAALRFVQDEIRYMGVELGENSHKPHDPNKVFQQRFGDCKDKSYLLCIMLKAMNIEAAPVLINTYLHGSILDRLPAVTLFDHVTVRVLLNNKEYWFDPTITDQRGGIDNITYPGYDYGLVLSSNSTAPVKIKTNAASQVRIKEVFNITDMSGNATLAVNTEYVGFFADDVRRRFSNNSKSETEDTYRDFYSAYFKNIQIDSLSYHDDEITGKLVVNEYYSIQNIWEHSEDGKKIDFTFFVIASSIKKPTDLKRDMPYAVQFPEKYVEDIEINLPEEWNVTEADLFTANPAFRMGAKFSYSNQKITLHYDYESFKDHVLPEEMNSYMASYDVINNNMGFSVTYNDTNKSTVTSSKAATSLHQNSPGTVILYIIVTVLMLLGLILFAVRMKS
jgi:transglutaminase-like putative cysteine protease